MGHRTPCRGYESPDQLLKQKYHVYGSEIGCDHKPRCGFSGRTRELIDRNCTRKRARGEGIAWTGTWSVILPKTHRILERKFMEFRPFGKDPSGATIRDMSGVSIRSNAEYLEESVARTRGVEAGKRIVEELVNLLNGRIETVLTTSRLNFSEIHGLPIRMSSRPTSSNFA